MADSPSNIRASVETDEALAAAELPAALVVVVDEDGLPVIDLREPPAADGALAVVDGEFVLRLADGTEWPVATTTEAGPVVLQLGDQAFVLADAVKAALGVPGAALTVASLAAAGGSASVAAGETPASAPAAAEVATPAAEATDEPTDEAPEPVSGGAEFRAFVIGEIGDLLQPTLALAPTARDAAGGGSLLDDLGRDDDGFAANRPGGGSRFVNLDPQARADVAATTERQAVEIDVLANDRDPNPGDRLKLVKVDGSGLEGEVSITPDGKVVYDPNGKFTHLAVGETATETFTYTVADQHGGQSTAAVTVTVHGVNDAPLAADDHAATTEKSHVVVDVLANDTDPDASDALQVVAVDLTGLNGALGYLGDGQFVYDPAGQFIHLGVGQSAIETFLYQVSDPHGATDIATVQILIHGVNDAPIAQDDLVWVSEEGHVRFNALANDFDPDTGDTLRVSNLFSLGGSMGQRWINHDGTVSYRPHGAYEHLGKGEIAYQKFGYTVTDQHGATDTATITVAIVGLNDAPVARNDKAVTNEDTAVVVNVIGNDYDIDATDTIQVVAVDPTGLAGSLTYLGDGKFAYDPSGAWDHLAVGQSATETFRYMIADQHGATAIAEAEILIHGVNDAPTAVTDQFVGYETIGFYAPIAALLANDYDVDSGDTFQFAGLGGAVNGTVALTPDGYVVFTPTPGYTGPAAFQYAIQDQHGAYDIGEVQVDVRPITPGDMAYETVSWFAGVSDADVQTLDNGVTLIDLFVEVGAIAAAGLSIGGMPFFSASLSGILQGVISVAILPDGSPLVTGNLAGDLDLQIETSPIFAPLGGDVYDALYLASGTAGDPFGIFGGAGGAGGGGAPSLADLGFGDLLADLMAQVGDAIDLDGVESLVQGLGLGDASALAFGNGTFYLDIAGLISGAITVPGGHDGEPLVDADIVGQFAAAALFDIRDDLTVVSDGFVDGDFDVAVAPSGIGPGFAIGAIVSEEPAMAA
jgi:VCBS repeat-containing protein